MFLLLFPLFLLGGLLYGRKRTNMHGWTAEHLKGWEYYIKKGPNITDTILGKVYMKWVFCITAYFDTLVDNLRFKNKRNSLNEPF